MLTFCSSSDLFSFWSLCNTVPLFYFLFGFFLVTEDSVDTIRLSDIAREYILVLFFNSLL